jgi:hypothetical protein
LITYISGDTVSDSKCRFKKNEGKPYGCPICDDQLLKDKEILEVFSYVDQTGFEIDAIVLQFETFYVTIAF